MRRTVTLGLVALACLVAMPARAHERCAPEETHCLRHWPVMMIRAHAGLGAFLDGGAVTTRVVPDLAENARLSAQLQVDVGVRPFGGGLVISVIILGQAADGAVVGTGGLSIEEDLVSLWDSNPNRDFALALGGALAIDYAHSVTTSAAGAVASYDLLRPDWRGYLELRIRASERERWLVRAQIVTGFDDLLDLASVTLCGGYVFEAY